eukprot:6212330-Pleurochrysis_carterae.AAC.4
MTVELPGRIAAARRAFRPRQGLDPFHLGADTKQPHAAPSTPPLPSQPPPPPPHPPTPTLTLLTVGPAARASACNVVAVERAAQGP